MQSQSSGQTAKTNRPAPHRGDDVTRKKRRGQDFGLEENRRNCCFCDKPVGPDEGTSWGGCKKHYVHFHCIRDGRACDLYAALSHMEAVADLGPLGDQLCLTCMAEDKIERRWSKGACGAQTAKIWLDWFRRADIWSKNLHPACACEECPAQMGKDLGKEPILACGIHKRRGVPANLTAGESGPHTATGNRALQCPVMHGNAKGQPQQCSSRLVFHKDKLNTQGAHVATALRRNR